MSRIAVRVFGSHPAYATILSRMISAERDFRVVSGDKAPSIAVFDYPSEHIDLAVAEARRRWPSLHALLLTESLDENLCLRWILNGIRGAVGYDQVESQLVSAIRQIAQDRTWFPARVIARCTRLEPAAVSAPLTSNLTPREAEIAHLLCSGLTNQEIADIVHVSQRTVKFHATNIYAKLKVGRRRGLRSLRLLPASD